MNYSMKLAFRLLAALITFLAMVAFFSLFTGCYTKRGCIEKVCVKDTVRTEVTVRDTVVIDRITADTIFSKEVDTVTLVKDKLVIHYRREGGKIHLSGEVKADTIYRERVIEVAVPCNCPGPDAFSWRQYINAQPFFLQLMAYGSMILALLFVLAALLTGLSRITR